MESGIETGGFKALIRHTCTRITSRPASGRQSVRLPSRHTPCPSLPTPVYGRERVREPVAAMREALAGLEVYPERMRQNLEATGGLIMAEQVTTLLIPRLGRLEAHDLVKAACGRVVKNGTGLRHELMAEPVITDSIPGGELDTALDPGGYLGSAETSVERALNLYYEEAAT